MNRDNPATAIVTTSAVIGIPRLFTFWKEVGAIPSFASDHSIRVAAYNPEFATDNNAVIITKFIISAAYGIPILSNTTTNGLSITPASFQEINPTKIVIVKMKNNIMRHTVLRIARGIVFSGSSLSPAAIPINSVPWNEKLTVIIVSNTAASPFGKSPPSLTKLEKRGAASFPSYDINPNNALPPSTTNARIVITLILENQNSNSA
ncbi:Uncharacterised protein [Streptococcus pneumoniae]|nr:Uncharacterised protein [Streptococcus pneumoniae]CJB13267.1 Uncharacterised protein [Streptococcus pneumoniae]